jgi:putative endonuclease
MPVRFASLSRQLHSNGQRLHRAMASRTFSQGPEQPADEVEQAMREERRRLKEQQKQRHAQALLPRPKAMKPLKEVKPPKAPKAPKAAKPPKEAKAAKAAKGNKPSRADKQTQKAANVEAAKKAGRKSAKT